MTMFVVAQLEGTEQIICTLFIFKKKKQKKKEKKRKEKDHLHNCLKIVIIF